MESTIKIFKKIKFKDQTFIRKKNLIKKPSVGAIPLSDIIGIKKRNLNVAGLSVFRMQDILLKSLP